MDLLHSLTDLPCGDGCSLVSGFGDGMKVSQILDQTSNWLQLHNRTIVNARIASWGHFVVSKFSLSGLVFRFEPFVNKSINKINSVRRQAYSLICLKNCGADFQVWGALDPHPGRGWYAGGCRRWGGLLGMGERPVGPGRAGRPDRENKGRGGGKAGGPAPSFQPPYRTDHHDCNGGHHDDHHRHHWGHRHRFPSQ